MKVLITGGAGFIGSHTVDLLVKRKHHVRILDNLEPQVHGRNRRLPPYIKNHLRNGKIEFIRGDVRDGGDVQKAVKGMHAVIHLAAALGLGQSMYSPSHFTSTNVDGTAILWENVIKRYPGLKKFVVASSMSIYGEGAYRCPRCHSRDPLERTFSQMKKEKWEPECSACRTPMVPLPTAEDKMLQPTSIYAFTKKMQEDTSVMLGSTYGIPTYALRYFNVYGSRQSLSNPYTGVIAIFLSRLLNKKPPIIFEDGLQSRDFIHVEDIARANVLALTSKKKGQYAINIGTGRKTSVLSIARALTDYLGVNIPSRVLGKFRTGDIRHCFSDPSLATTELTFRASIPLSSGIKRLIRESYVYQPIDRVDRAIEELDRKSLIQ